MTATKARHFLETCNDAIESGMTADLRHRILEANAIVAANFAAQREAKLAAARAAHAVKRAA